MLWHIKCGLKIPLGFLLSSCGISPDLSPLPIALKWVYSLTAENFVVFHSSLPGLLSSPPAQIHVIPFCKYWQCPSAVATPRSSSLGCKDTEEVFGSQPSSSRWKCEMQEENYKWPNTKTWHVLGLHIMISLELRDSSKFWKGLF